MTASTSTTSTISTTASTPFAHGWRPSPRAMAAAAALVVTGAQFAAVDLLAHRGSLGGPQIVQLERVVITGKRVAAAPQTLQLALACDVRTARC